MSDRETNNADHGASTPGTILRRCREFRGASIQDAAGATKIAEHHLRALEQDRFTEFANPAYLKGFLRIYSDYLGLSPDDMIRLCERQHVPPGEGGDGRPEKKRSFRSVRRSFPWKKLFLPAVLLLMMIVTSVLLDHSPLPRRHLPRPLPLPTAVPVAAIQPALSSSATVALTEEAEPVVEAEQPQSHDEAQAEKGAHPDAAAEVSRGVVVRLRVIHNASLAVTMDGTTSQHYELTSGDTFEWKADRTIALELSNAGSAVVELNGRSLGSLGANGAPVYVLLDANGIRQQ
ncbi:RodZ domain-containing protein [Pelobacter propionicus]|uniref:Transcriptional regulator, putative n=1 Tax=Pelobacter propionicus (strain DSM 2379 / NBRC 103807 / OttBd1) TaxID=338966 RepID=A1AL47_PELPD|nr:RodZ domain-containing protein [Pelobacter propionicus]ABK98067.1 transcriptional regulator, putative [Pelobacter propionicus DSM 2379]